MEILMFFLIDLLLIVALCALAWFALSHNNLRSAIIFFMAFGLLLALVWFRLAAPDLAIAEAAIGAGLSGALFLTSLRFKQRLAEDKSIVNSLPKQQKLPRYILDVLLAALIVLFSFAFYHAMLDYHLVDANQERLAGEVFRHLEATGVTNPVTAVLLDYRAYDTMLELVVMLAAIVGIISLGPATEWGSSSGVNASKTLSYQPVHTQPMLSSLYQWLVPLLVLFSGYILWTGAHAPGGAFQAAALLAAAGVVLHLSGHSQLGLPRFLLLRLLTVSGVAGFLLIGLLLMLSGHAFLDYPAAWAGVLILAIESLATLSIAAILLIAFLSGKPEAWDAQGITCLGKKRVANQSPEQLLKSGRIVKASQGKYSC